MKNIFNLKQIKKDNNKAFTLIELLVVIAIIGILSSVVLVSLTAARERGKIATIKSTLKQLYNQAAINQLERGDFRDSNISYYDLTCKGNLADIAKPLIDQGIVVKCFSFYGTGSGFGTAGDDYRRFGATALIYDEGELKAWSVDENGIVKWDLKGVNSSGLTTDNFEYVSWATANTACVTNGGRLPSIEQLRTLSHAWYQGSGNTIYTPIPTSGSFEPDDYWSSTYLPSSPSLRAYFMQMYNGHFIPFDKTSFNGVRCVR